MKTEFKKIVLIIFLICASLTIVPFASAGDPNGPQHVKTPSAPPRSVVIRDAAKEVGLLGAPPISPVVIVGVPDYIWRHGCGPTALGNVVGYYDTQGYSDLITGDASSQTNDVNQAIASGGDSGNPNPPGSEKHYEDYSRPQDDLTPGMLPDDYIAQSRNPHPDNCIGDYMKTSQSNFNNRYGWSWSNDIGPAFTGYVNQQNASYNPTYTEYNPIVGMALTWAVMTNEIDNGRPMVFLVDDNGDNDTDHFVTVVGYDTQTNQYGFLDTWNVIPTGIRWETFQSMGNYQPWSIWGGWSFRLSGVGETTKWEQLPDTTPNGMDVRCDRKDNVQRVLADDFMCTQAGPIDKVIIWGSWKSDIKGQIKKIHLSIHSDDPIGPGGTDPTNTYSKPDQLLWSKDFDAPDFNESLFADITPAYEYWWQPGTTPIAYGDQKIWKYEIPIDPCVAFVQQGTPTNPIIYWLDTYVVLDNNQSPPAAQFGWKTSGETMHRLDDAVWSINNGTAWNEMHYPPGHPKNPLSADLSFVIITGHTEPEEPPESDLGDAPDSTNNSGLAMTAYPAAGTMANYPTVYLDPTGLPPFGPIHQQPQAVAWLGPNVTLENEADIGPDQDPTNNIIPPTNTPDQDLADDGVLNMPLALPHCLSTNFKYNVNVVNPNVALYVNVWCDWNRDGDWDDIMTCGSNNAPEWAVQNQLLPAGSMVVGMNQKTTPSFRPWHPTGAQKPTSEMWMRITLSEQPWVSGGIMVGNGGCGPANGYDYGETEDYRFVPITECVNSAAPFYTAWVGAGKPWSRPACWCCQRNCRGDADCLRQLNLYWVYTADLTIFRSAYALTDAQLNQVKICADFNHLKQLNLYRVYTMDLAILRTYYGRAVVPVCPMDWDGDGDNDYNFWTN